MASHSTFLEEEKTTERLQALIAAGKLNEIKKPYTDPIHVLRASEFDATPIEVNTTHTAILHLRDVSFEVQALDVAISDDQVGLLLPMNLRIQTMKLRTKLKIEHEGQEYSVMYIGGNLVFKSNNCELRVLSFCRIMS